MIRRILHLAFTATVLIGSSALAAQADRFANVEISALKVNGSIYMLTGAGGNIGVSVGADGTMIIDDQYAPLADRIQKALDGLGGDKPRLVLNTHVHGDHTGSNAHFGARGTIIAHDNVRVRLLTEGVERTALPLVTYSDRMSVHFNDNDIELIHMPAGHTDGDSIVWFKQANVAHLGDHLFNGSFPFIDIGNGGSVSGFVANLESALKLLPDDIQIIPGHGALGDSSTVSESISMIHDTLDTVKAGVAAGKSADEIIATGLDPRWASFGAGFINEERWIRILLAGLPTTR